jgi:alpha-L-rhamnosidase
MKKISALFLLLLLFTASKFAQAQPVDLKCEYKTNPIGIDVPNPEFCWYFNTNERDWRQTAYQIVVSESLTELEKGKLWNSGKISSGENIHIIYKGKPLKSIMSCYWKVKVWDKNGKPSDWSKPAYFKTGMMNKKDWQANWIASDIKLKDYQAELRKYTDFGMEPETVIWDLAPKLRKIGNTVESAPAIYMRKEFNVKKNIKCATAVVCGLGLHELYLNGNRIGEEYLNPAPSDYQKRVYYNTYDITKDISGGKNAAGIILGNGWYNLITPHVLRYYAADYIAPPQLLMEIHIEYTDGKREIIKSDNTWKFTTNGPITFNCLLAGETYDAQKEMNGWCSPGYNENDWKKCQLAKAPEGKIIAQNLPPVKNIEKFPAQKVYKDTLKKNNGANNSSNKQNIALNENIYIFDLGKEIVGWAKVKMHGKKGQKIKISYPGSQSHTLGRYQTCYYILKGEGEEVYEPRFCYNGFRYVYVSGLDYEPSVNDVYGMQVCSAMEPRGNFACSNEKLTKIQKILLHTVRNYILHLPNDPTREKAAWTQDIENCFDVEAYNFDCALMYSKWQDDFLDIIHKNGYVPPVAPSRFDGPTINGPWWGGMIVYNPWKIYQYFGDKKVLEKSYNAMKKYMGYLASISENNIVKWGLGDWLEPGTVRPKMTPVPLTSTCGYFLFANILKNTAEILGKKNESLEFAKLADKIKKSYNEEFLKNGVYALGSQASQIMSLYFGLVPEDQREKVIKVLLDRIKKDSMHVNTGFVSTPILLQALSELGFSDIAYTMTNQNTYPSWFDMVFNKGNTVLKESWDGGLVQMPSLGGGIGAWFFHSLAGIRQAEPGFKKIIISPEITGDLKWVKCNYESISGNIISNWEITGNNELKLSVTIPSNTRAEIYLPVKSADNIKENGINLKENKNIKYMLKNEKVVLETGSGTYNFIINSFR